MTQIRPLAPDICPSCGAQRSYRVFEGAVRCMRCGQIHTSENDGHVSDEELETLFGDPADAVSAITGAADSEMQRRRESYRPSFILKHKNKDEIDAYSDAIFSTAMEHVVRKDWDGAIKHLRRALDYNRNITDVYLWLGRLLPDEAERRAHLKTLLSLDMQHGEGLRELMILDGEIAWDQPFDDFTMPEVREAGEVEAEARGVKCPRCGAPKLNSDPLWPGILTCGACGHEVALPKGGGDRNVARALIRKRSQAVEWVIGARVLACNGCGAQRTLAANQLAEHCPFCGSRNVITQDATGSLAQPDSVIPFAMDEREAADAVREALKSGMERVKGWFVDNRAERLMAEGVYLPYWVFDASVDVTRIYRIRDDEARRASPLAMPIQSSMTDRFADAAYNVAIPGVAQPPAWLLARIGKFEFGGHVAYAPELIAQHSAEIYTRDFDKAAMDAHGVIGQAMREKYNTNTSSEVTISVSTLVKPISFRLILVPVWAVTIHEKDGDVRPALVNGQTGKVAFGKAAKPK